MRWELMSQRSANFVGQVHWNVCYTDEKHAVAPGLPVTILYWKYVGAQSVFKGISLVECFQVKHNC